MQGGEIGRREDEWLPELTGIGGRRRRQWRHGELEIERPGGVGARVFGAKGRGGRGVYIGGCGMTDSVEIVRIRSNP